MPFLSKAQSAWAHTPEGTKALGGPDKIKEWEDGTDYSKLPGHVVPAHKKRQVLRDILQRNKK